MANRVSVVINNKRYDVEVYEKDRNVFLVKVGSREYIVYLSEDLTSIEKENLKREVLDRLISIAKEEAEQPRQQQAVEQGLAVTSKVPGRIVKLMVKEGDVVEEGQVVAVIESMKMAIEVRSPHRGRVKRVLAQEKGFIDFGQPIALLESV